MFKKNASDFQKYIFMTTITKGVLITSIAFMFFNPYYFLLIKIRISSFIVHATHHLQRVIAFSEQQAKNEKDKKCVQKAPRLTF